ncbi:MAG: TolC family protein [bacterium]
MPRFWEAALACSVLVLGACAHHPPSIYGGPGTSVAPSVPWVPPAQARLAPEPATPLVIPEDLAKAAQHLSLAQVLDVALRTSTQTRVAWAQARSAAAAYGSQRGDYLPVVNVEAIGQQAGTAAAGGRPATSQKAAQYGADASWLLFDFGGREAAVDETRQALVAADWTHNAVIQNVMLEVEQAYYQYVTTRALLAATEATQEEAKKNLDAAEARHENGLATIADVLQARTAASQVELNVEGLRGQIATARGALATSMGLPANTPFDVEAPPETLPDAKVSEDVEQYLAQARRERPDLAAAAAQTRGAEAHVKKVKAEGYPSLSAQGSVSRLHREGTDGYFVPYTATISLRMPIFTGFSHGYDVKESEADADAARARQEALEQLVVLQVWTSYYDFKTAEQRLKTTADLLNSAGQSHDVALGRYQEGVGTILDLLTAQASLAGARAADVQARADWFLSLAQLAHDTGTLGAPSSPEGGSNR